MKRPKEDPTDIDEILNEYKKELVRVPADSFVRGKVTTSSFFLDCFLDGGFSVGSWSNFWGGEESGKTSMALTWARNWQLAFPEDGFVLYFNAEGRLTEDRLKKSGLITTPDKFRRVDTNQAETVWVIAEKVLRLGTYKCFIIIDSLDALGIKENIISQLELIGWNTGSARINSLAGARVSILVHTGFHHLFVCSQLRDKLNTNSSVPVSQQYGGHAPKHYSSLRGVMRRKEFLYADPSTKKDVIGRMTEIKFEKTPNDKTGARIEFPIKNNLNGGIWSAYEAMMIAQQIDWGIYKKDGNYYRLDEKWKADLEKEKIEFKEAVLGDRGFRDYFDSNPSLVNYILGKARLLIGKD